MRVRRGLWGSFLALLCLTWAGCPARVTDAELLLSDPNATVDRRIEAASGLELDRPNAYSRVTNEAWAYNNPTRLRLALLDLTHRHSPEAFWLAASFHWENEANPDVVAALQAWVTRDGALAETATLRYLASASGRDSGGPLDHERHRELLSRVSDRRAERANLIEYLTSVVNDPVRPPRARFAAWGLLAADANKPNRRDELRQWLRSVSPATPLAADLQSAAEVLCELPRRTAHLMSLSALRDPQVRRGWDELVAAQPDLSPGMALRHVGFVRGRPYPAVIVGWSARFDRSVDAGGDALHPLDRAALGGMLAALDRPDTRADVFNQADADHADTMSEHGGLASRLDEAGGAESDGSGVFFRSYPPTRRVHDRAYHAPVALLMDRPNALATYHFHAERHANAEHDGPGSGDLRNVTATGMTMVVFTFLDRDTLSVKAAVPGAWGEAPVVVSLGTITRPKE